MSLNLSRLKDIALVLDDIKDQVVFVGGATVALYIDDVAAPTPQPSEDIDCVVEIATYGQWCQFEELLRSKGFQDTDSTGEDRNPPTCRKFLMGMKVDFMPVDEAVLGYGNPWFKKGLENSVIVMVEGLEIRIFSLEYFVASKLKAFNDRGITGDIRFSQDLEDLTELIDGCTNFEKVILNSQNEVKTFIISELSKFIGVSEYCEAMYGFIGYDDPNTKEVRLDRIFEILKRLKGV